MSNPLMIIKLDTENPPMIVNDKAEVSTLLENFNKLKTQLKVGDSDYFAQRLFDCLLMSMETSHIQHNCPIVFDSW